MDDLVLLRQYAKRNDSEAIRLLIHKHGDMVLATCRRRSSCNADADDAAQDVFLSFMQDAGRIRSNVGGWLRRRSMNVVGCMNRSRRCQARHETRAARQLACRMSPEDEAILRERLAILDECLGRLKPADQQLIVQSYVAEKTQEQIAASMGVSRQAIAKRVGKAVIRLRHELSAKGVIASIVAAVILLAKRTACTVLPHGLRTSATASVPAASAGTAGTGAVGVLKAGVAATLVVTAAAVTYEVVEDRHHEVPAPRIAAAKASTLPISSATGTTTSGNSHGTTGRLTWTNDRSVCAPLGTKIPRPSGSQVRHATDWPVSEAQSDPATSALARWQLPPMSQYQNDALPAPSYTPSQMRIASSRWPILPASKAKTAQTPTADSEGEQVAMAQPVPDVLASIVNLDGDFPAEPSFVAAAPATVAGLNVDEDLSISSPTAAKLIDGDAAVAVTAVVGDKQRIFRLANQAAIVPASAISITKDKAVSVVRTAQWTAVTGNVQLQDTTSSAKVMPVGDSILSNAVNVSDVVNVSKEASGGSAAEQSGTIAPVATPVAGSISPIQTISITTVKAGTVLAATGTLDGRLINQGVVAAENAGSPLYLTGLVSGRGSYTGDVVFSGGFSPGNSPTVVHLDYATLDSGNTLTMELAGPIPGSQYDQLIIDNHLTLGGGLDVKLLYDFTPSLGDSFTLLSGDFSGRFSSVTLPALNDGLRWDTDSLYTDGSLEVVPEPATMILLVAGGVVVLLHRRYHARLIVAGCIDVAA